MATPEERKQYLLEFAYTSWADSCRTHGPGGRSCRRPAGHTGRHAAGYDTGFVDWEPAPACHTIRHP